MNKYTNKAIIAAIVAALSTCALAGPPSGGPGGGSQPGGNQPGSGGSSATWTFDTFIVSSTTTSGIIIRDGVITGFESPTAVTVDSSVTSIEEGALAGCTTLTSIDLSSTSITEIPSDAFAGCTSLATVMLPSTCTTIGANAFAGCTALKTFTASGLTTVESQSFYACSSLTTPPSSVKTAGSYSFARSGVTSVDTSDFSSLDEGAFAGCESLASATVGSTLPAAAFAGCTALDVSDWSGVTSFGDAALAGIPATTLTISSSATLGEYALAADEATVGTTLTFDGSTVPSYDDTVFLGRSLTASYTPVAGTTTRVEACDLVEWLAANADSVTQPTSYATADLETWLSSSSNADAIFAFCYPDAESEAEALTISGTTFTFTDSSRSAVVVTPVGTDDLTDAFSEDAVTLAETATSGVYTATPADTSVSQFFMRLKYEKAW